MAGRRAEIVGVFLKDFGCSRLGALDWHAADGIGDLHLSRLLFVQIGPQRPSSDELSEERNYDGTDFPSSL